MTNLNTLCTLCVIISHTYAFSILCQPLKSSIKEHSGNRLHDEGTLRMSAVTTILRTKQRKDRVALSVSPISTKENYAIILNSLSNEKSEEAAQKAEEILFSLEIDRRERLTVVHYASVINCWANAGNELRAESILNRMIENSRDESESVSSQILPNSHCFAGVMKSFINSSRSNNNHTLTKEYVSQKCEDLLELMNDFYIESASVTIKPNTVVYNTLLKAYSEEVTAFFQNKKNDKINSFPNILGRRQQEKTYKAVVEKAVAILDKMESSDFPMFPTPDKYTYSTTFSLLAKCGDMKTAALAESYLPKISDKFDTPSYNALISAWAATGSKEGAERADNLLQQLENAIEMKNGATVFTEHYGPNTISYFAAISACVKSCSIGDDGLAAEKAEAILARMESKLRSSKYSEEEKAFRFKPNVIAYSSIIDCWSKSGSKEAGTRVKKLLERMESQHIEPNVFTYTSCLATYSRSATEAGAKESSSLLARMEKMYHESGEDNLKPTIVSYFTVIDGWARSDSKDMGNEAEALLRKLEDFYRGGDYSMKPDVRVYARVISAHIKSIKKGSDKKAIGLLKEMENFALTDDETFALAKPNVVCYNTLISAFGKRGLPIKAFNILNQMDQFNSKIVSESDKAIADEHTFNSIIYALSRSNLKGKARKAMKMLERLENSHIDGDWRSKPSTKSYNMVISTCSNSFKATEKERSQALKIGLKAFSSLKSSPDVDPDRYTYILLLKTCGKLLPTNSAKRRTLVENVFGECCNSGLVDNSILSNFLIAAPKDLSKTILSDAHITDPRAEKLPKLWTRNASFR